MSHHHHTSPLTPSRPAATTLPHNVFGALVGTVGGALGNQDDNHVFVPLRISTGPFAGLYRLAFNTQSTDNSSDQYYVHDEPIEMSDVPSEGFTRDASLSYAAIGLHQEVFRTVANGVLRSVVASSAADADLVAAYGFTFSSGNGLHDIHYHNGESAGGTHDNKPNQDGALLFYTLNRSGQSTRRWIFIKFKTQELP